MAEFEISNPLARRLWLATHGLGDAPTGPLDTMAMIRDLGFVQLDTIQIVSRAHQHILWSRNQNYRAPELNRLLRARAIFEHFTHDASVLPMEFLPLWRRQFDRMKAKVERGSWHGKTLKHVDLDAILRRVSDEGPLSTKDFDSKIKGPRQMWQRPPHKVGLDYLWYSGQLATSHRIAFTKYYDLAERVFPEDLRQRHIADEDQIEWLCQAALDRLGFGTLGEIRRFWDATEVKEVSDWAKQAALVPVRVQAADGSWSTAVACPDIEARVARLGQPSSQMRILNPFDPAIRDRARIRRLFGFDYTVEMFVPAAKRQWGYYVYPLLEKDRFVGRIEVKADRGAERLDVMQLWWEPGLRGLKGRAKRLDSELRRFARLAGAKKINWICARP